jgi:hypothetical protein
MGNECKKGGATRFSDGREHSFLVVTQYTARFHWLRPSLSVTVSNAVARVRRASVFEKPLLRSDIRVFNQSVISSMKIVAEGRSIPVGCFATMLRTENEIANSKLRVDVMA